MYEVLLTLAVLIGVSAGVALVARSPAFWMDFGQEVLKRAIPIILKRKTPEEEKLDNEKYRRGELDRNH